MINVPIPVLQIFHNLLRHQTSVPMITQNVPRQSPTDRKYHVPAYGFHTAYGVVPAVSGYAYSTHHQCPC